MQANRKNILYGLLGVIIVYQGGSYLYGKYVEAPRKDRESKIATLEKSVNTKTRDLKLAKRAAEQLVVYEQQSLPADPELARTAYSTWLLSLLEKAKFQSPSIDAGAAANRKGMYQSLSFSVRGQATLEQLTQFLYAFYKADHLHQIRSLAITPVRDQGLLDLSFSIESLMLPGATNTEGLNPEQSDRLAYAAPNEYRMIAQRDLFGVGGALDPVSQTYLSGVTATNGQLEAWFSLRATDKTVKLKTGEKLDVGAFLGTVVNIDESDVVLESDGERWLLTVGENLDQADAIPPGF